MDCNNLVRLYYDHCTIVLCVRYNRTMIRTVDKVRYKMLTFYGMYRMYIIVKANSYCNTTDQACFINF